MAMRIIEITESKQSEMSDMCEEMLTIGGRLMSCIREMGEGNERMGERRRTGGMRDGYGMRDDEYMRRGGMRDDPEDWPEYGGRYGMRRR